MSVSLTQGQAGKRTCSRCAAHLDMSSPDILSARFWSRVTKSDGCWVWGGGLDTAGYGQMRYCGGTRLTHHISWFFEHGSWPSFLMHSCDTPTCVNPSHLREGNHKLNAQDCAIKGRLGHAKLDPSKVIQIRKMRRDGVRADTLSQMFGVSKDIIYRAARGANWAHVKEML